LDATRILWLIASAIGLLPLALMALLALVVLVILFMITGSQMSSYSADPSASSGPESGAWVIRQIAGGDGEGTFSDANVPDKSLVDDIKAAAGECDLLTPVIIAAQIEYASNWDTKKEGPGGRKGLSQLAPDVFDEYGEDDDESGEASALDPVDSIRAHGRYFCHLAGETRKLLDDQKVLGDHLTLTLMAWEMGLEAVEALGGMPVVDPYSYPFVIRGIFSNYTTDASATPTASASTGAAGRGQGDRSLLLTADQFDGLFPSRNSFYTYAGLKDAMGKFPAFAGTGDEDTRKREIAAFLANLDHESGGLVHIEEINQAAWGNYCDTDQPYGCPAGRTAYHGRGPIQLSWNTNYKAAGDALGIDLLNKPDLVKTDASVAWQTALWFWMTQPGAGSMTAHAAITGGAGFGETIRTINGTLECGGRNTAQVQSRVNAYKRFAEQLGVDPGDESRLTC